MAINVIVQSIKNSKGEGEEQKFARPMMENSLSSEELADVISERCTLTKSDIEAVLISLSEVAEEQLSAGNKFHIPHIGFLGLRVQVDDNGKADPDALKGSQVSVKNITFRAESKLLNKVKENTRFTRSKAVAQSIEYSEDDLKNKISEFFETHQVLTSRDMSIYFGLKQGKGRKWLLHLCESGYLVKEGSPHYPVYILA